MDIERIELPGEITAFMDALKRTGHKDALHRIAAAHPTDWGIGHYRSSIGQRCLVGLAAAHISTGRSLLPLIYHSVGDAIGTAAQAFDRFAGEVGATLAGYLCATYARALLEGGK